MDDYNSSSRRDNTSYDNTDDNFNSSNTGRGGVGGLIDKVAGRNTGSNRGGLDDNTTTTTGGYGNDNLDSTGRNTGIGNTTGSDRFDNDPYSTSGRGNLDGTGRDNLGGSGLNTTGRDNLGGSGLGSTGRDTVGGTGIGSTGRDDFGSSGRDNFGSIGRDNFGSTGRDNLDDPTTGTTGRGNLGGSGIGSTGRDDFGGSGIGSTGRDDFGNTGRDNLGGTGRNTGLGGDSTTGTGRTGGIAGDDTYGSGVSGSGRQDPRDATTNYAGAPVRDGPFTGTDADTYGSTGTGSGLTGSNRVAGPGSSNTAGTLSSSGRNDRYDDNTTGSKQKDSTMGKLVEKVGEATKNTGLAEKGRDMREKKASEGAYNDSNLGGSKNY